MKPFVPIAIAASIVALAPASRAQPVPAAAPASPSDGPKEAESHFRRGLDLYRDGDPRGALVEFKRAYELAPNYRALYNVAETYFQLQRYADAMKTLQAYLSGGGSQIPADKRASVENEVRLLQNRIGTIDVKVNLDGAQILIDDEPVGTSPLSQSILVSVGHRKIGVIKSGLPTQERFVDVAAGDHASVSMEFTAVAPAPAQRPASTAPGAVGAPLASAPPSRTGTWVAWGIVGAFGAATAVTGVLTLSAKTSLTNQLDAFPGSAGSINDARDKVRTFGIVTDVLLAATAVAGGVAIYISLTGRSHPASMEVGVGPSSVVLRGPF